jgi:hypothetical protein
MFCATLFSVPHRSGNDATEEGHSQIPLSVHLGVLEIVRTLKFRWAQALIVNYPRLLISRHLWISKRGKQIL